MKISLFAVSALVIAFSAMPLQAAFVNYTGSSGNRQAGARFELLSADELQITLSNTATVGVANDSENLTGLFFNISGDPTLTKESATLAAGSYIVEYTKSGKGQNATVVASNVTLTHAQYVPSEWGYVMGHSSAPRTYGLSAAGLGIFGASDVFDSGNNYGPGGLDGADFGLLPLLSDDWGNNTGVNGGLQDRPLIENSVVFTLGVPGGFDLSDVSDVLFQYGTTAGTDQVPGVPAPTTPVAIAALGALGLAIYGRRRRARS